VQLAIQDLFTKIQNADIHTEPFDHLIVDNLLPEDLYKEVSKELEAEDFSHNYEKGSYGAKERFGVDITSYSAWIASGRKSSTTIHQDNYNLLSKKLTSVQFFIDLLLENEKGLYSVLGSKLPTERIQDDYFFHVHMNKDSLGYKIVAHVDAQNIFTILFYAPETDINKTFGLNVYGEGGTTPVETYGTPRNLELVKHIDFIPNRMLIFAPSESTWHSVSQLSDELVGTRNSFQMFFLRNQ